jgi:hypothetical protein
VLEFRAVDLDNCTTVSEQNLGSSFYCACLASACRPQKQQVPDWAPGTMQASAEHLVQVDQCLHGLLLPDDFLPQRTLELASCGTAFFRVQNSREPVICTLPQART